MRDWDRDTGEGRGEAAPGGWRVPGSLAGRTLLTDEGACVAPVCPGVEWTRGATPPAPRPLRSASARALPEPLRERVAQAWLADALAEHAAIASFARASLELMAVGAPPDLLTAYALAAADQVGHAERCFALAARYSGVAAAPGPLPAAPARGGGLERVARDVFLEGCVGETVASLAVTRALAVCCDHEVALALRSIGKDEERHAALAWRTVAWAVSEGGVAVADALRETWRALRAAEASVPVEDGEDTHVAALLAVHGRLDRGAERRVRVDALEGIVAPTLTALLERT